MSSIYRPLSPEQIRVIHLHPGPLESEVFCTLETVSFETNPKYSAISYAWGNPEIRRPIKVNGERQFVTTNLVQALKHLRYPEKLRVLWVDAICINQNNLDERSAQVQIMAQIYQMAETVEVWLGPQTPESDRAFELIKTLGACTLDDVHTYVGRRKGTPWDELDFRQHDSAIKEYFDGKRPEGWEDMKDLGPPPYPCETLTEEDWTALRATFCDRSWYQRLWPVQEVFYGEEINLHCGLSTIPWSYIHAADGGGTHHTAHVAMKDEIFHHLAESIRINWTRQHFHEQRLETMLETYKSRLCSDPRDKIFALCSIMRPQHPGIIPDYTKSVAEVFTAVAIEFIQERQSLDLFARWRREQRHFPWHGQRLEVPLWVPDWTAHTIGERLEHLVQPASPYRAAGLEKIGEDPVIKFHDNLVLEARGIFFDRLVRVYEEYDLGAKESEEQCWHQEPEDLENRTYPTGEDPIDAYWRTLFKDALGFAGMSMQREAYERIKKSDIPDFRQQFLEWRKTPPLITKERVKGEMCFERRLAENIPSWSFAITERGYFAQVNPFCDPGDEVWIVHGSNVPLILDPRGKDGGGSIKVPEEIKGRAMHDYIGAAYVHGIMDGEVVEMLKEQEALAFAKGLLNGKNVDDVGGVLDDFPELKVEPVFIM